MKRSPRFALTVIGAGKVGSVLGKVLLENGERIVCIVSRSKASARKGGRFLRCKNASSSFEKIPSTTNLIFITTPHSAVERVVAELSNLKNLDFRRIAVCHASGMLTADALEPVRRRGATVFSFHPLQTFPRDFEPSKIVPTARGIYYGVDGSPAAVRIAGRLAAKLEGKIIEIPPEMRAFYHAACVVASNHLTTVLSILEQMHRTLGTKTKDFFPVFKPILMATMRNIEGSSPAEALSGPIARGGVETLAEHFAAVKKFTPHLVPYFAMLSAETVQLARAKGSIDQAGGEALLNLIHSQTNSHPHAQEVS